MPWRGFEFLEMWRQWDLLRGLHQRVNSQTIGSGLCGYRNHMSQLARDSPTLCPSLLFNNSTFLHSQNYSSLGDNYKGTLVTALHVSPVKTQGDGEI